MSKINAVRFINLNYNHNAIRVSDEIMYLNGESTLVKLDNGGGKSVLVQMMTAPFVQKRYRNTKDRPFAGYFTTGRPTFILVEWKLDQGAGYVMTGMMVRRNQNMEDGSEEELEIINFISEYKEPCQQDLRHLPVTEKTRDEIRLKSFAACRQLFDSYKKDRGVRFFTYDMNHSAQSRQYFEKLAEYGINFREWQNIIKKVNEEESGLSKLFADCRDERGLIEKWFLETIENKLNKEQNRIQEFRNILEKYIGARLRNQTKIEQRDVILRFADEAEKIRAQAEACRLTGAEKQAKEREIAAYLNVLRMLSSKAEEDLAGEQARMDEMAEEIRRLDHQRLSAAYYRTQDEVLSIKKESAALRGSMEETEERRQQWERALHLLEMADKQEQADSAEADYQQALQALDVCRKKGMDLQPEREYIGWLLRQHGERELESARSEQAETDRQMEERTAALADAVSGLEETEAAIREAMREEGGLKASVRSYDREEQRYAARWKEPLSRNILGEYEPGLLRVQADTLSAVQEEAGAERTARRKMAEQAENAASKLEQTASRLETEGYALSRELEAAEARLAHFDEELAQRRTILRYLELREDALFDRERILLAAERKAGALETQTDRLTVEADRIREEIRSLTTGRNVEIPEALQTEMDALGIHTVYGMEWLKRNGNSEEENLALVERCPFLPYALVMSRQEFLRLSAADLSVYTPAPIPVVTRESLADAQGAPESLADAQSTPEAGGAEAVGTPESVSPAGVHFYVMFNRDILNEEKLAQLLARREKELAGKTLETERLREAYRDYLARKNTVAAQEVTAESYDEAGRAVSELSEKLRKNRDEAAWARTELAVQKQKKAALEEEIAALTRRIEEMQRRSADLADLMRSYDRYLAQKSALEECRARQDRLNAEKARLQSLRRELEEHLLALREKKSVCAQRVREAGERAEAFRSYHETGVPEGFDRQLERDIAALSARYSAITENVSREEKELEEAGRRAAARLDRLTSSLRHFAKKYALKEEEWRKVTYSIAEQDHAEAMHSSLRREWEQKSEELNRRSIEMAGKERDLQHLLESMMRECGADGPMAREEIREADYAAEKNVLLHERTECAGRAKELEKRRNVLESNLTALSEFGDLAAGTGDAGKNPEDASEDLPAFAGIDFGAFTGEDFRGFTVEQKRTHRALEEENALQMARLEKVTAQMMRMEIFSPDAYRKPLETLYGLCADAEKVLSQLAIILQSYHDLLEKLMVDISVVEQEREHVIGALEEYVAEIHSQMGKIDRNSGITVRGRSLKMLRLELPDWEQGEGLYRKHLEDYIDGIAYEGMTLLAKGEALRDMIGKKLTTRELYDETVGIGNIRVQLYKIEAQRELPISWSEVARNSGGEGFLSAFVILSSLLYYMRRDETDVFADRNEGKVLLMDNPFAQTNAAHLLQPMMEMARKNNTQLICLTGLGGESIYNCFNNIYVLNLMQTAYGAAQLKGKHIAGSEPETVTFSRFEVTDGQMEMDLLF